MLTKKEAIHARLVQRRRELLARYRDELARVEEELAQRDIEAVERSAEEWDARVLSSLGDADLRAIVAVNEALQRLHEGSYGTCVHCELPIGAARLDVIPRIDFLRRLRRAHRTGAAEEGGMNLARVEAVAPFDRLVTDYMTRDVVTVRRTAPIAEVAALMDEHRISCIPVVDEREVLCGVITRTDLVALGVLQGGARRESAAMPLPRRWAADVMVKRVVTAPSTATVRAAAQLMSSHAIHHVVVVDNGRIVGILSAIDLVATVRDAGVTVPLSSIMTAPAITIDVETPLGMAVELLARVRVSGLIVTANDLPMGTFTPMEALAARDLPRATPVEVVFEPAVLCLPDETTLSVAAAQLTRFNVRRIVACSQRSVSGIATALDFARYIAW